jgi:DNA-binding transcriptional LysR family regulator
LAQVRIRHLKLVEALVDTGSLHKAAKALHMSQPAASAILRETEKALGVTLFDRTHKGVALNDRGRIAVARLRTILGELSMLAEDLHAEEPSPVLRIGVLMQSFFGVLQSFLPRFLSRSDCRVDLIEGSAGLLDRLLENELDCVIGRMPAARIDSLQARGVFYQPLYDLEVCVLAGPSHPLARKLDVTLDDLSQYPWILPRQASNNRYLLESTFAAAGLKPPKVRIGTSSFVSTFPLLPTGDFLTVAPRDACVDQERLGRAKILAIRLPQLLTPVAFVAKRSSMMNPNVRLLWQAIREAMPVVDQGAIDIAFDSIRESENKIPTKS